MKKWLRKKMRSFLGYDDEIKQAYKIAYSANARADEAERVIRERTDIHVDISPSGRDPHVVVMIGKYHGRDFVQTYSIRESEFKNMLDRLLEMKRYGEVRRIDAPPNMRSYLDRMI